MSTSSKELMTAITNLQDELDEQFNLVIDPCDNWLKEILSYYHNLGGKRLRPTLLIASSLDYGIDPQEILPYATALELMHTFSLFHDDVIDGAKTRRGAESIQVKYDIPTAIIGGDVFHSLIHGYITEQALVGKLNPLNAIKFLNELTLKVELPIGSAVLQESNLAKSKEIPPYEISLKINAQKTGPVFALGAATPALLQNYNDDKEVLWKFGDTIGLGYQLLDDLIDIIDFRSGKDIGGDFREKKKTPLFIKSYLKDPKYASEFLLQEVVTKKMILNFYTHFHHEIIEIWESAMEYLNTGIGYLKQICHSISTDHLLSFANLLMDKAYKIKDAINNFEIKS